MKTKGFIIIIVIVIVVFIIIIIIIIIKLELSTFLLRHYLYVLDQGPSPL